MSWTRSVLELSPSPVEVNTLDVRIIATDLTTYLDAGSVVSPSSHVFGGLLDSPTTWLDVTSTILQTTATTLNVVTNTLHGFTAGYGYRVVLTYQNGLGETLNRFYILRCLY